MIEAEGLRVQRHPLADPTRMLARLAAIPRVAEHGVSLFGQVHADLIATTTMATHPVLQGDWLQPGTHLDLIGAYRPDMREVDDEALKRARIFVDSRSTTIGHIGEIQIPLDSGVISKTDIVADFYDLSSGDYMRRSRDEITIAKNGGGAHLDLMTARYILDAME